MSSCHKKKDDHCKPRKKKHCHPHHEDHCHGRKKRHHGGWHWGPPMSQGAEHQGHQ